MASSKTALFLIVCVLFAFVLFVSSEQLLRMYAQVSSVPETLSNFFNTISFILKYNFTDQDNESYGGEPTYGGNPSPTYGGGGPGYVAGRGPGN
ncbi:hypothetical protein Q3G72_021232 [Acer saccharum]|nr:hypothetical protein Q3G72_021232 [Acer saccharum]